MSFRVKNLKLINWLPSAYRRRLFFNWILFNWVNRVTVTHSALLLILRAASSVVTEGQIFYVQTYKKFVVMDTKNLRAFYVKFYDSFH